MRSSCNSRRVKKYAHHGGRLRSWYESSRSMNSVPAGMGSSTIMYFHSEPVTVSRTASMSPEATGPFSGAVS